MHEDIQAVEFSAQKPQTIEQKIIVELLKSYQEITRAVLITCKSEIKEERVNVGSLIVNASLAFFGVNLEIGLLKGCATSAEKKHVLKEVRYLFELYMGRHDAN